MLDDVLAVEEVLEVDAVLAVDALLELPIFGFCWEDNDITTALAFEASATLPLRAPGCLWVELEQPPVALEEQPEAVLPPPLGVVAELEPVVVVVLTQRALLYQLLRPLNVFPLS